MKAATGELNLTVITVVAIAAVAAFFYAIVWPAIKNSIERNTHCAEATCPATCKTGDTCECTYLDSKGTETKIKCKLKD